MTVSGLHDLYLGRIDGCFYVDWRRAERDVEELIRCSFMLFRGLELADRDEGLGVEWGRVTTLARVAKLYIGTLLHIKNEYNQCHDCRWHPVGLLVSFRLIESD